MIHEPWYPELYTSLFYRYDVVSSIDLSYSQYPWYVSIDYFNRKKSPHYLNFIKTIHCTNKNPFHRPTPTTITNHSTLGIISVNKIILNTMLSIWKCEKKLLKNPLFFICNHKTNLLCIKKSWKIKNLNISFMNNNLKNFKKLFNFVVKILKLHNYTGNLMLWFLLYFFNFHKLSRL